MTEEPGDRVQALFDQVVDLPPEGRSAFLDVASASRAAKTRGELTDVHA